MMIPAFRIAYGVLLAGLLLVSSARAEDVLNTPSTTSTPAVLPQMDNPVLAAPKAPTEIEIAPMASSPDPDKDVGPPSKYVRPTWSLLLQSMIRNNALSLDDLDILNEYIEISDCDIYERFYQNDFEWRKIKSDELAYLQKAHDNLPIDFHYDTVLQFGRYDFDKEIYLFTDKTKISNVNSFMLYEGKANVCPKAEGIIRLLPLIFHAVISEPIGLQGIPMKSEVASALFDLMKTDKNFDRLVYTRFNLHVKYIAPLEKRHEYATTGRMMYFQGGHAASSVRLDATLDSIDFYEDANMTKLIYQYVPHLNVHIPDKADAPAQ